MVIHRVSQFQFYFIAPNIMMEQKGKGYQGIRAIEVTGYENTSSDFKYCDYTKKNEKQCQTTARYTRDPRGIFR